MIRFDQLPPEVTQAMCTPMHQILPPAQNPANPAQFSGSLYLGSLSAVMDKDLLREKRITHLVHVLDVPWLPMAEKEGFVGYKIAIADQDSEDIRPHLEAVCNYIDAALKSGRNVLVHCHQVSIDLIPSSLLGVSSCYFLSIGGDAMKGWMDGRRTQNSS